MIAKTLLLTWFGYGFIKGIVNFVKGDVIKWDDFVKGEGDEKGVPFIMLISALITTVIGLWGVAVIGSPYVAMGMALTICLYFRNYKRVVKMVETRSELPRRTFTAVYMTAFYGFVVYHLLRLMV